MKYLRKLTDGLRNKYLGRPIFQKVLTGYLALSTALIALTVGLCYMLFRWYAATAYIDAMKNRAQAIARVFARQEGGVSAELLRETEQLCEGHVMLIDRDYTVRFVPRAQAGAEETPAVFEDRAISAPEDRLLAAKILEEGRCEASVRYSSLLDAKVIFVGAPVPGGDGGSVSGVLLYQEVRELRGITLSMTMIIIASLATAGMISMALAFVMSRRLTRPLRELTRSAGYIAQGHYGETTEITQNDEIGALGRSLNDMSARLSRTIFDLQSEKAKLEQIIADIGEGIVAVNKRGDIIHRNGAALELLEIGCCQKPEASHREHLLDMLNAAMNDRERAETRWVSESGRAIRARVWPIMTEQGEIAGAVGLLSDVSELERLERMRRDYVANVSHELRTPLTGIQGMIEPLMDGYIETEEERMECYRVIHQETLRLEKLIGEMLDMSRLQSGRLTVELEPMDVVGVMHGAARRMREQAAGCGVSLEVDPAQRPMPMVMGNEDRVMQVLIILLDNALSFTPAGGKVTVYAREACGRVYVGVKDTGAGIDPADMPYIWERFYKADKSRMRTTGTGLGLSIAKLVCELMDGSITASSEPGRGATFEFTLNIHYE
ncbi:MAG: HAMP domain-containing protein [Clostridia bacterium]|nr:HAMP domain-containing protein [Clostridia bacterium]